MSAIEGSSVDVLDIKRLQKWQIYKILKEKITIKNKLLKQQKLFSAIKVLMMHMNHLIYQGNT